MGYLCEINILLGDSVSSPVWFTFVGPPTRPEGPLKVSDVTKDSAKLSWNKPKDDGGLEIR